VDEIGCPGTIALALPWKNFTAKAQAELDALSAVRFSPGEPADEVQPMNCRFRASAAARSLSRTLESARGRLFSTVKAASARSNRATVAFAATRLGRRCAASALRLGGCG
jgi:hypothetical protein